MSCLTLTHLPCLHSKIKNHSDSDIDRGAPCRTGRSVTILLYVCFLKHSNNKCSFVAIVPSCSLLSAVLSLDTTRAASTERTCQCKIDMLLAVDSNHERRDINNLLANTARQKQNGVIRRRSSKPPDETDPPDVLLADEDASVMNRLRESLLENKRLKATLEEIVGLESEHIIELVLSVVEEAILVHARHQCLSLENTLRILLIEREESPCSISDLAEDHLHAPELSLVAQAVFSNQLQLCIQALLLERAARLLKSLAICRRER